ncbi:MAG: tetratricopeptide repeat protein [Bryobacteraceae bacterium]
MASRGSVAQISVATIALGVLCPALVQARSGIQEGFEAQFQEGTEALRNGQLDEAAADFSKCIAAAPNLAESYFDLGLVRLQQDRWDEAAGLFNNSLKLKPELRGANLFLGIARYRLDQYPDAVLALKREAEREPI